MIVVDHVYQSKFQTIAARKVKPAIAFMNTWLAKARLGCGQGFTGKATELETFPVDMFYFPITFIILEA